jgi:hypothetical protein
MIYLTIYRHSKYPSRVQGQCALVPFQPQIEPRSQSTTRSKAEHSRVQTQPDAFKPPGRDVVLSRVDRSARPPFLFCLRVITEKPVGPPRLGKYSNRKAKDKKQSTEDRVRSTVIRWEIFYFYNFNDGTESKASPTYDLPNTIIGQPCPSKHQC